MPVVAEVEQEGGPLIDGQLAKLPPHGRQEGRVTRVKMTAPALSRVTVAAQWHTALAVRNGAVASDPQPSVLSSLAAAWMRASAPSFGIGSLESSRLASPRR